MLQQSLLFATEKLEKQVSHPDVKSGKDNIVMFNLIFTYFCELEITLFAAYKPVIKDVSKPIKLWSPIK